MKSIRPWKHEEFPGWEGFKGTMWKDEINVRDFIQKN